MINIYTESGIRGPKKRDGYSVYILETIVKTKSIVRSGGGAGQMVTKEEPLTLTKGLKLLNENENQSQLTTLLDAMKRIKKPGEVTIYIPSSWIHTAATEWVPRWKLDGWKNSKGEEVALREQWEELDGLLGKNSVIFEVGARHHYTEWMLKELSKREKEESYVREIWRDELVY